MKPEGHFQHGTDLTLPSKGYVLVPSGACPPEFKAIPFKAGSEDMGIILLLHTHDLWRLWDGNGVPRSGHVHAAHLCNCFAWGPVPRCEQKAVINSCNRSVWFSQEGLLFSCLRLPYCPVKEHLQFCRRVSLAKTHPLVPMRVYYFLCVVINGAKFSKRQLLVCTDCHCIPSVSQQGLPKCAFSLPVPSSRTFRC